jgi:hypothetical protein
MDGEHGSIEDEDEKEDEDDNADSWRAGKPEPAFRLAG